MAEPSDAISILLAGDPASHAGLDNPQDATFPLRELNQVGASDAIGTLIAREQEAQGHEWG